MSHRYIRAAMAAAMTAVLVTTVSPAASAVEPQSPDVQIVSPTNDDANPLSGPFTLVVSVDLGDNAFVQLIPTFTSYGDGDARPAPRTVTAQQCPALCTVSFDIDPTNWQSSLPSSEALLNVSWSSPHAIGSTDRRVPYVAPVQSVWIAALERDDTAAVRDYHPAVMDTGGSLVITAGTPERVPGEVLEARVYPGRKYEPLPAPVLTGTGSWDQGAQPHQGRIKLETAALASGSYRLLVRSRNSAGQYGAGVESVLTVRHQPVVDVNRLPPFLLAGEKLIVGASVSQPLPDGVTPGSFRVSVDGGPAQILPVQSWPRQADISVPIQGQAELPAASLPAGARTLTVQILDSQGRSLGAPTTGQIQVVTFTEQATVTTLVVGEPSVVTFRGTAPAGMSYDSCTFMLIERVAIGGGGLCSRGDTSYTASIPWSPQTAGPGKIEFSVTTVQNVGSALRTVPVVVYAKRTATLSAVSSSAYGTKPLAKVTVRDMTNLSSPLVAANGAAVVVQRKMAGTSTWLNVGSGRTDATGQALVPFTNTASGRLRAVVASSVPAKSVISAERAVTSVSTVSWSSLPTSTRSGALAYASVVARPYEGGASVRVQARFAGGSWLTLGTASMSTTGEARPGFRLYTRGTWEVRVMRVGTTLRASGYSSVRRVSVN